ncbi:MAG: hypothetical protein KKI08_16295, partial [Armatimonadetes bacterium]|nr:hypothetical protein [Armatimonadota bacterium]
MHQRRPTSVPLLVRGRAVLPGAILVILLTGGCSTPPPRRAVVTVTPLPTSPPRPEPGAPSAPPPVLRRTAPAGQADFFSALGNLRGAVFDRQSGRLTILADEALPLPAVAAADWAAILRCAQNGQGPAFSLDPADPHNPHGPKLRCVYIGSSLQGTPLGMAMFTADWEMKLMGVGDIRLPISGFKDLFDLSLAAAHPSDGGGAFMRFWITCAGLETRA